MSVYPSLIQASRATLERHTHAHKLCTRSSHSVSRSEPPSSTMGIPYSALTREEVKECMEDGYSREQIERHNTRVGI